MNMYALRPLFIAGPLALALFACADDTDDSTTTEDGTNTTQTATGTTTPTTSSTMTTTSTMTNTGSNSLVDVATAAGDFGTLLAAVDAAGLTSTLAEDGPFTVIAPTDDAFAALPDGMVDALLMDIPELTDVLLYHVVSGEVPASAVLEASLVTTLLGPDFKVSVDGDVFINDAMITMTDIEADNGIIHVIDAVLIPPPSITAIAAADPQFSTLVAALTAADLATTLDGPGPFTVFAPTDSAFDALPAGTVDALLADIPELTDILLYHVAGERLTAEDVVGSSSVTTLQGSDAAVMVDGSGAFIDGAQIVVTDIPAENGTIHIIDAVMLP
jgi:uncharacterized surface protein with fasciclin (FAS1) repeats